VSVNIAFHKGFIMHKKGIVIFRQLLQRVRSRSYSLCLSFRAIVHISFMKENLSNKNNISISQALSENKFDGHLNLKFCIHTQRFLRHLSFLLNLFFFFCTKSFSLYIFFQKRPSGFALNK
jgi:hypothetical protein